LTKVAPPGVRCRIDLFCYLDGRRLLADRITSQRAMQGVCMLPVQASDAFDFDSLPR
jgi:hypothetical protein